MLRSRRIGVLGGGILIARGEDIGCSAPLHSFCGSCTNGTPYPLGGHRHLDVPHPSSASATTEAIRAWAWGERRITASTISVGEHRRQNCLCRGQDEPRSVPLGDSTGRSTDDPQSWNRETCRCTVDAAAYDPAREGYLPTGHPVSGIGTNGILGRLRVLTRSRAPQRSTILR